MPRLQPARRM